MSSVQRDRIKIDIKFYIYSKNLKYKDQKYNIGESSTKLIPVTFSSIYQSPGPIEQTVKK